MALPVSAASRRSTWVIVGSILASMATAAALFEIMVPAACRLYAFARPADAAMLVTAVLALGAFALAIRPLIALQAGQDVYNVEDARFVAAADASFDALLMLDAVRGDDGEIEDFVITYLNRHARQLIDLPQETLLRGNLCELLPVFRNEGLFSQYVDVMKTGRRNTSEFPIQDKHINADRLRCSVVKVNDGVAVTASNLTQRNELEQSLCRAVQHDSLTGLPNRALLDDRIQQAIERCKRNRHAAAVMILDIDGFTQINEEHGRDAGNHVLKTVAARLRAAVRTTDSVFRLGGDEFVILFADLSAYEPIADFARKVMISLLPPIPWHRAHLNVSASIGTAMYPQGGSSPETLLVQADIAMYRMKRSHVENLAAAAMSQPLDLSAFSLSVR